MSTKTIQYGDEFLTLHTDGCISREGVKPSGKWRVTGAWRLNNFGNRVEFVGVDDILAGKITDWHHKNGKQKWHVMDIDHGTPRLWMFPNHSIK
jgi:hypothetical protein